VPRQVVSSARREGGTASVELIAVVPVLLLAVLVAAQIGLVGQALWSAAVASRAGARAAAIGDDAGVAARRALPQSMRAEARVSAADAVSVRVPLPRLLPILPKITVGAETNLGGGDG
jgi:Flp pilus assembly protein TadG